LLNINSKTYLFDQNNFIDDYYNPDTIKEIIKKIGFKTYYRQGYISSKLNAGDDQIGNILFTGFGGFILGLMYKEEVFDIKSFEELASYLCVKSQIVPLEKALNYLKPGVVLKDVIQQLKKRIYDQLDRENDIFSENIKWALINRERNYCNRCYDFYSAKATPVYTYHDDDFYNLMFNLSKEQLKNQKAYINSMYKYLFCDSLYKLGRIKVDQRGRISKDKYGNFVFNSRAYMLKHRIINKLANKFNLNASVFMIPFYLLKKDRIGFKNKVKHLLNDSYFLDTDKIMVDIDKKRQSFYNADLSIMTSLSVFESMIREGSHEN
jgi:hypothetical protein